MQLTQKLISFLNRVFDKSPKRFLALRLGYEGGMTWRVEDAVLRTTVSGGVGRDLEVDLSKFTLAGLVGHLASQPGYSVLYADASEAAQLSARVLIDGSGDIAKSNGDHLYGYTSVLWAFLEPFAGELAEARRQIAQMLLQMSTKTASDLWLDELGSHYGIPRLRGELDVQYGPRIIAEVLRPRENNVAMAAAIKIFTGQDAKVTDVVEWSPSFPVYSGEIAHDGSERHESVSAPRYGLFDVEYGYDLANGGDFTEFQQMVLDLVNRLRAAGTHLRALGLKGSAFLDAASPPQDVGGADFMGVSRIDEDVAVAPTEDVAVIGRLGGLGDTADQALDGLAIVVSTRFVHNGLRSYGGEIQHLGISTNAEDVGSAGDIPFSGVQVLDGAIDLDGSELIDGLV